MLHETKWPRAILLLFYNNNNNNTCVYISTWGFIGSNLSIQYKKNEQKNLAYETQNI